MLRVRFTRGDREQGKELDVVKARQRGKNKEMIQTIFKLMRRR